MATAKAIPLTLSPDNPPPFPQAPHSPARESAAPAIASAPALGAAAQRGRPLWLKILFLLLVAGAVALAFYWQGIKAHAIVAASFGARMACSCRFESGRALDHCTGDFEPGMELVTISEDSAARSVTARFPLLARQTATYREGWGCVLEKWEN